MNEIRDLIAAAGSSDSRLDGVVREIGVERVADMLLYELVDRADLKDLGDTADVTVQFDLRVGDQRVVRAVRIRSGMAACEPGAAASPEATVAQDLADLTRAVFGPRAEMVNATRSIVWKDPGPVGALSRSRWANAVRRLTHRLLRGSEDCSEDLGELLLRFGSDKWGAQYHPRRYERHFAPVRDRPLTILEFGIGGYEYPDRGGSSLRAWKRYFRRAMVYGIDLAGKYDELQEQRIRTLQGRQADPRFLASAVDLTGPLDIVIDDAGHDAHEVINSFRFLFPHLRPGGIYAVEDAQTSYRARHGGSGTESSDPAKTAGFFKSLVDGLTHEEFDPSAQHRPTETDLNVASMHFYPNLVILEKGRGV
jgi:hypothetical protein